MGFSVNANAKTILVVGDSLSAAYGIETESGWVNLLRQKLNSGKMFATNWKIRNASISGETTSGGLARLPALLDKYQPALCIIALGANDGLRGQSIEQMKNNLTDMINLCDAKKARVLLLGMRLPPNYGKQYTQAFQESFKILANTHKTALVPFFLKDVAGHPALMQSDGIHPTTKAQKQILANIWPTLCIVLEGLSSR